MYSQLYIFLDVYMYQLNGSSLDIYYLEYGSLMCTGPWLVKDPALNLDHKMISDIDIRLCLVTKTHFIS